MSSSRSNNGKLGEQLDAAIYKFMFTGRPPYGGQNCLMWIVDAADGRRYRMKLVREDIGDWRVQNAEAAADAWQEMWRGRAKMSNETALTEEDHGYCEGEICNRNGCKGVIEEHPVEGCSCHIAPPCSACVRNKGYCDECGWAADDEDE